VGEDGGEERGEEEKEERIGEEEEERKGILFGGRIGIIVWNFGLGKVLIISFLVLFIDGHLTVTLWTSFGRI